MAMLALAFVLAMPSPEAPSLPVYHPAKSGIWSQYGLSPTQGQIWYHTTQTKLLHDPAQYDGFIAVASCDLVGREALIQVAPSRRWYRVFIFDCSGHVSTTRWMRENNILGELSYDLWREIGVPAGKGTLGKLHLLEAN